MNRLIATIRPGLVVVDKVNRKYQIREITVPNVEEVKVRDIEEIVKYQSLTIKL